MKSDISSYFLASEKFLITFYRHFILLLEKDECQQIFFSDLFFIFYHFCRLKGFWIFKTIKYCLMIELLLQKRC